MTDHDLFLLRNKAQSGEKLTPQEVSDLVDLVADQRRQLEAADAMWEASEALLLSGSITPWPNSWAGTARLANVYYSKVREK